MAALSMKYCIGTAPDGATGIGGCEQKLNHRSNGQVVEVIAYEGCLLDAHTQLLLKRLESCWFVLDAHKAMADPKLPSTHFCRSSLATTEKGNVKPCLL
tara:strand:- start:205 stop:501 length:297 start_codon:yes stop_codon:yes gene_type:complete